MEMILLKPYLDIIEYFGVRNQMRKLNEECFEFLEAVDNYEDELAFHLGGTVYENTCKEHVIEEMSDILVLLTEFFAKYNIKQEDLNPFMDYKLNRTLERIKSKFYDK